MEFSQAYTDYNAELDRSQRLRKRFQARFDAQVVNAYRSRMPKTRRKAGPWRYGEIAARFPELAAEFARWSQVASRMYDRQRARELHAEAIMHDAARATPLQPSSDMYTRVTHESEETYRYTCRGMHYAKVAAEFSADDYRHMGFAVHIRRIPSQSTLGPFGYYSGGGAYEVWINADPLAAEHARIYPDGVPMTMKEWADKCRARGTSPQVFNPFYKD